jgi:hypothetical protein
MNGEWVPQISTIAVKVKGWADGIGMPHRRAAIQRG